MLKGSHRLYGGCRPVDIGTLRRRTGIANLANSIAAIRKLVFDDHVINRTQLKHALETNFEDSSTNPTGPQIHDLCRRAPKYGNDDPYVDNVAKNCLNILLKELGKHQTRPGQSYGATIAPVVTHPPLCCIL